MNEGGEFGHLIVERSGGIAGLLLVWDLDIDSSEHRESIGPKVAELPWQGESQARAAGGSGADRYVYAIESRFGLVRFGEADMPGEWKNLVEQVREITEPERRRPGTE
ncbi:MAG: hypothetical protein L0I80_05740 [Brevibacterium sp.]|uniref:protealysin inhibitor emfourin n=1 Tax=Brevibacterium sp. TaxID=1701 RepID=UPI00264A2015|nr:protealysin inhibitor emfourin [Brevibacterium sp.]MDN5807140.1 hypothetical protein [Brevibacterium sp.]MDN5833873.1 hypothetical protein [Brevibacterium sp.]MDN5876270.1 hypothetical protein [Brevibacterium sp.]MDN5909927.1 hypothetical protein [Brevibacterium sp.]MDN6123360.1 hypothetical protein [Brevibacterium sp.]